MNQIPPRTKNILIGTVIAAVGLVVLFVVGNPGLKGTAQVKEAVHGKSPLALTEESFDFGTISMANGTVMHAFDIKNTASTPIRITKIYTSCMCTEAILVVGTVRKGPFGMPGHAMISAISETVGPGEKFSVEATFDPAAHGPSGIGSISRVVYVESDAGDPVQIGFSANVTP